jgi:4-alpha-glucanotransferase
VYALHDATRPAAGDFGTLRRFGAWAAGTGASVIGTLPMLATFVGYGAEPRDPSPYAPVSRRFWNEAYLDPHAIDPRLDVDAGVTRDPDVADVVAQSARLRAALEPLVPVAAFSAPFRTWLAPRPDVIAYARFRAEREGSGDPGARYHEVVQWWCEEQLAALTREFETRGQSLYLDLPIGAHRDGFDVAIGDALFVRDASVGAPPDDFQPGGQNWGFPPMNPVVARADGYAQFRAALEAHLRFAPVLRIDHVMGLHRLWFVPDGASATEGAYVRSDADALWAACCLLAHRYGATIVGENLGTVPEETNRALDAHGALKMWVLPFASRGDDPLRPPEADELACLDTHDLAPYAAWWRDLPDAQRDAVVVRLQTNGALDDDASADARTVLAALLGWLGRSDAPLVLATLEDLWFEPEPQNRPGTPADVNFRHRGRHGLDELADPDDPTGARALLRILDEARTRAHQPAHS